MSKLDLDNALQDKLNKLNKVTKLIIIPVSLYLLIVFLQLFLSAFDVGVSSSIIKAIEKIAFYSFPLFLLYLVTVTFFSSYWILESKNYKNLAVFFLFMLISAYLITQLKINVPSYSKLVATSLTIAIASCIVIFIKLIEQKISSLDLNDKKLNENRALPRETLGMIVSGLFSIVISSMIYFHVKNGISFVTWGVSFGALLSIIFLDSKKLLLGILYFLEPSSADNIYEILKLKKYHEEYETSEVSRRIKLKQTENQRRKRAADIIYEIEDVRTRRVFEADEKRAKEILENLKDENLDTNEIHKLNNELDQLTAKIDKDSHKKIEKDKPLTIEYKNKTIKEKIIENIGLTEKEISDAIDSNLIEASQAHIWSEDHQKIIRYAMEEADKGEYKGDTPIFVASSVVKLVVKYKIIESLSRIIETENKLELSDILGSKKLKEFIVKTPIHYYSVIIIPTLDNSSYFIVGCFLKE